MANEITKSGDAAHPPTLPVRAQAPAPQEKKTRAWTVFAITMTALLGSTIGLFFADSRETVGLLAMTMMLCLIFLKVPVAFAMIIPSLLGMYVLRGAPLVWSQMKTVPYSEVASWSLSVVPMFILMGLLMWRAGLTTSIFESAKMLVGWVPGGLAIGTNLAGTGLAAVSGSSVGVTYALARSAIPEMLKAGYNKRLAIGSVIVAGLPGQLIPPSIMLIIYAGIAETPVGPQLLAGVGPGLLVAFLFSIALLFFAWKTTPNAGRIPVQATFGERVMSVVRVWPVPIILAIIIVGMFSGLFTATEAAAVAALTALGVTFIWKRQGGALKAISEASIAMVSSVGAIFLMLIGVGLLSRMFTLTGISELFAHLVEQANLNRVGFLLVMMVVYIVLGTFMEPLAMMVLTIPILIPTLANLEISLLWYGAFAVLMGEIAVVSPPVGILAFIIHQISQEKEVNQGQKITLNDVFISTYWLLPVAILVTVVLIFFPEISTWLPDLGTVK